MQTIRTINGKRKFIYERSTGDERFKLNEVYLNGGGTLGIYVLKIFERLGNFSKKFFK